MEDRASAWVLPDGWVCAGVYDGHVGDAAAAFCADRMHMAIAASLTSHSSESALARAFESVNTDFLTSSAADEPAGTTAVVLLRRRLPDGNVQLFFASAGDSRAVLHDGQTLTREFKPDDEDGNSARSNSSDSRRRPLRPQAAYHTHTHAYTRTR